MHGAALFMYRSEMRMHEPIFPEDMALYIIWASSSAGRSSVAAGGLAAMKAAWEAIQMDYPRDTLTLQHRARVLRERAPIE